MAAEELTESVVGSIIGAGAGDVGTAGGMVCGIYTATCTENDDWVILSDFDTIKAVHAVTIIATVHTTEPVEIDSSTTNKVIFNAGGTDVIRMVVWGTPANTD